MIQNQFHGLFETDFAHVIIRGLIVGLFNSYDISPQAALIYPSQTITHS